MIAILTLKISVIKDGVNFDNIRFTCSRCPGQVALIMLVSIKWDPAPAYQACFEAELHKNG
jgi:hypothetical protein